MSAEMPGLVAKLGVLSGAGIREDVLAAAMVEMALQENPAEVLENGELEKLGKEVLARG